MKSDHVEERRKFISDAFHTLNQPLTGLHCGLELSLQRPRSEGEYRQRIGTCVEYASDIIALIRAVRQLVDAGDPGEQFGTIPLATVLARVKSEVEVVAEATGVRLEMDTESSARVKADPAKLAAALGGLIAAEVESLESGGLVRTRVTIGKKSLTLHIDFAGSRNHAANGSGKIVDIRRNAAVSYLWTIGGQVRVSAEKLTMTLPNAS